MTANVVDKRRNEKAKGVVNVIIKMVSAAAFENQVSAFYFNFNFKQEILSIFFLIEIFS